MDVGQPNLVVRIVCLANSRKISGRCIAGKKIPGESWIRPVSARQTREISELDRRYSDGETAKLLEIIDIPCISQSPEGHHPENMLIDDRFFWTCRGKMSWGKVNAMIDSPTSLWVNGYSTYYGLNNRIPEFLLRPSEGSLHLIAVDRMVLHAGPKAPDFGNMKPVVRACFEYHGTSYRLDVTDPEVEAFSLRSGVGDHTIRSVLMCISLSELFEGFAYKLVAAIITEKRAK